MKKSQIIAMTYFLGLVVLLYPSVLNNAGVIS